MLRFLTNSTLLSSTPTNFQLISFSFFSFFLMDNKMFFVNLNFLLYWTLISSNFKFYTHTHNNNQKKKKKRRRRRLHLGVRQNGSEFLDRCTYKITIQILFPLYGQNLAPNWFIAISPSSYYVKIYKTNHVYYLNSLKKFVTKSTYR